MRSLFPSYCQWKTILLVSLTFHYAKGCPSSGGSKCKHTKKCVDMAFIGPLLCGGWHIQCKLIHKIAGDDYRNLEGKILVIACRIVNY